MVSFFAIDIAVSCRVDELLSRLDRIDSLASS